MKHILIFSISFGITFCLPSACKTPANSGKTDLNLLKEYMIGDFSSEQQSKSDKDFRDIRLHIRQIWHDQKGVWLYVEQAAAETENNPYRQRIYQLKQLAGDRFSSEIFTLPDEKKWAGAYRDISKFKELKPESLTVRQGCTVFLKKEADGTFAGSTHLKDCESNLRGATYATTKVVVKPRMLYSWDQGFDKNDVQVWGAEKGGYEFIKN